MADWGLSVAGRATKPYELNEWWLKPGKVITDPIHGDVFITRLEQAFLDTPPMQRLRGVRQLGTTHLVYPGATHNRFSHSLGAVKVVQALLDAALHQRIRDSAPPDLFSEWEAEAREDEHRKEAEKFAAAALLTGEEPWRHLYRRWLSEATVLARLGALLHDLGHLPFGHTIEDDLRLLEPHDRNAARFKELWDQMLRAIKAQLGEQALREDKPASWARERSDWLFPLTAGQPFHHDLRRLILAKGVDKAGCAYRPTKEVRYPFVVDMVGNTICADLLDYLQRDHVFSGLPISLGHRYLSSFYVTPKSKAGIYKERMALLVARHGRERKDIVTEILKHLRYRYELQERVLVHHTKLAADAMVGKMIEQWLKATKSRLEADPLQLREAAVTREFTFPGGDKKKGDRVERVARRQLELLLLQHGDDGLLEAIAKDDDPFSSPVAAELATMLLHRRLYKPAANALRPASAEGLFGAFGEGAERKKLEQEACRHAGIDEDWHLVLWVPDPRMRLKLAELLVDDGKGLSQFKDRFRRGSEIYEEHQDLWTVSVFVHPTVSIEKTRSALAKLAELTGLSWDTHLTSLGADPDAAPEHLAAVRACGADAVEDRVQDLVRYVRKPQQIAAHHGSTMTQDLLDQQVRALDKKLSLPARSQPKKRN